MQIDVLSIYKRQTHLGINVLEIGTASMNTEKKSCVSGSLFYIVSNKDPYNPKPGLNIEILGYKIFIPYEKT